MRRRRRRRPALTMFSLAVLCFVCFDYFLEQRVLFFIFYYLLFFIIFYLFIFRLCFAFWAHNYLALQDLVKRITQCAERFAPSNSWYVGVITKVFRLAGDMVKPEVAHNLMQVRACALVLFPVSVMMVLVALTHSFRRTSVPRTYSYDGVSACSCSCSKFCLKASTRFGTNMDMTVHG